LRASFDCQTEDDGVGASSVFTVGVDVDDDG
jgi:hypothetical protein